LDDRAASREIHRVLKPGGRYVALIHVRRNFRERVAQKFSEYVFPRFRPVALGKYVVKKTVRPIEQPIQRQYTVGEGQACLEESGFRVGRVMSKETDPEARLIGPHVVIYVAEK
jgi:ubiquinone/menaquinone biosynthesis C-methylase UbiE